MNKDQNKIMCNWCGQSTSVIWVHGHGQCQKCGTNIDECCQGESCTENDQISHCKNKTGNTFNILKS